MNSVLYIAANTSETARLRTLPILPIASTAFVLCAIGFRRRRGFQWGFFMVAFALGLTVLNGCNHTDGTLFEPFTSTITVTASAGTLQQTTPLTITVN
jgi:hypothetical protein